MHTKTTRIQNTINAHKNNKNTKHTHRTKSIMPPIIRAFAFFLFTSSLFPVRSVNETDGTSQSFRPDNMSRKLKSIKSHLKKINKPYVKTIQSPDGDTVDCVLSHQQPAFDHPELKFTLKYDQEAPERPSRISTNSLRENFQVWSESNEHCPRGTIPIRRTSENEVLRASSVLKFGKKTAGTVQMEASGHEHAVGYASGEELYGAKASVNVWAPRVESAYEFSLSQVWVIAGSFGDDLNTVEAGWQVSPQMYGDSQPRFFTYWTSDAYQATGCYNLLCSGFVQTNNRVAIGAAISPSSSYDGGQFDITLLIWKDPINGNWWLELESELVGYWPSFLFSHLRDSGATMVQFGGEIVNSKSSSGAHTSTQMGSGRFPDEGFQKASYFRNIQVVDGDNSLVPVLSSLRVLADRPSCYDIKLGNNNVWGDYFYYGGPGKNSDCP